MADGYFDAGFTAIVQDVILGGYLAEMVSLVRSRPLLVVVLAPSPAALAAREAGRGKSAYGVWSVDELDGALRRDTPRLGLWLDTSGQTPEQTVDEILTRAWTEARVDPPVVTGG